MGEVKDFGHRKCFLIDEERVDRRFLFGPGGQPCGCGQHINAKECRSQNREQGAYQSAYNEWLEDHDEDEEDFEFEWNEETEREWYPEDPNYAEYWLKYDGGEQAACEGDENGFEDEGATSDEVATSEGDENNSEDEVV